MTTMKVTETMLAAMGHHLHMGGKEPTMTFTIPEDMQPILRDWAECEDVTVDELLTDLLDPYMRAFLSGQIVGIAEVRKRIVKWKKTEVQQLVGEKACEVVGVLKKAEEKKTKTGKPFIAVEMQDGWAASDWRASGDLWAVCRADSQNSGGCEREILEC